MRFDERKLYHKISWVGHLGDEVFPASGPGEGAMVFTAPASDHLTLILIVENPHWGVMTEYDLRGIINLLAINIVNQGGYPEHMLWYSCLGGHFDRITPSWGGRRSNGFPFPPKIDAYPCGDRSFLAFKTICQSLAIDSGVLLEHARLHAIAIG